jgi:predicted O-linked N-acetylglucosamine transferase (SPINDLY family)
VNLIDTGIAAQNSGPSAAKPATAEVNALVALYGESRLAEAGVLAGGLTQRFPDDPVGWTVLGIVRNDLGQVAEAELALLRALQAQPDYPLALNNLGTVLNNLGRLDEAEQVLRRALRLQPGFAEAHNNLGLVLTGAGRLREAEACYLNALGINPGFALAYGNLGNTLRHLGRLEEAADRYRQAIGLRGDYPEAHFGLACTLADLGQFVEAEAFCRWLLTIQPNTAAPHNNLGNVLKAMNRFAEAEACYRRTLELAPDNAEVHNNLGNIHKDLGRLDLAEASYRAALRARPDYVEAHSNLLFMLSFRPGVAPPDYLDEARRFGRQVSVPSPFRRWSCSRQPHRLRIGLVSGDFLNHPVGYFLEGLLGNMNPETLEMFAYTTNPQGDDLTARVRSKFAKWQPIHGQTDAAAARLIHDDGIDLLVDLAGHTGHNRLPLFAWKPAPVQIAWLGYFASTGVAEIDYILADPWTLPPDHESHFSEKVWRLPETRLCLTVPQVEAPVAPLPAARAGHVTFGCFNNLTKLTDEVVALWSRLLGAAPGSRLLLKATQLRDDAMRQATISRFAACGVAAERLILEGPTPRREYLEAYARVDIALDPFPYTGGTTSAEALWMGVPVLTLAGDNLLSRQGVGLLMNVGLPDWIAADGDDYVERAVRFASDIVALAALRERLREQARTSPIFDAPRFARHFETALGRMWEVWRQSSAEPPQS